MVSTRNHPTELPPPSTPSPSKALTKSKPSASSSRAGAGAWAHKPSNLAVLWLCIAVPVVSWDTGYVLLRPHSMEGGWLHPIFKPYALYATIDYQYGWPAWENRSGFTAAQSSVNIVETLMYASYLWIVFTSGRQTSTQGKGAPHPASAGWLGQGRVVPGEKGVLAVLIAYAAAVMTVAKTSLYFLNEYWSGFESIGHNSAKDIVFLYILPKYVTSWDSQA
ncbi:MAG: hypothetical protein M1833_000649 [Piccolia ochrophora]|nr:MAG: hypothetical protein M1833_000649 [Piccolia ochrophora]